MTAASDELDIGARPAASHLLPLTETVDGRTRTIDEDLIEDLVAAFYDAARSDDLLGPLFEERVSDWSGHLARMRDFWSTLVNRSGRYAGRPLEVHLRIPGLTDAHFGRWLDLWKLAVETHVPPDAREPFVVPAFRMARTMALHSGARADRN